MVKPGTNRRGEVSPSDPSLQSDFLGGGGSIRRKGKKYKIKTQIKIGVCERERYR